MIELPKRSLAHNIVIEKKIQSSIKKKGLGFPSPQKLFYNFCNYLQLTQLTALPTTVRVRPNKRRAGATVVAGQQSQEAAFLTSTALTSTTFTGTFSTTTKLRRSRRVARRATSTVAHSQAAPLTAWALAGAAGAWALAGPSPA